MKTLPSLKLTIVALILALVSYNEINLIIISGSKLVEIYQSIKDCTLINCDETCATIGLPVHGSPVVGSNAEQNNNDQ
jgi:hypothetical protein